MGDGAIATFDGVTVGTLGDLGVIVYAESARLERLRWVYDRCQAIRRADPRSFLALQIILPTSNPPDGPARAETRRRLPDIDPHIRRMATVAVGDDVRAAVVRTFIRCTFMLSPLRSTRFVNDTIPRGLEMLFVDRSAETPMRHEANAFIHRCFDALDVPEDERLTAFGPPSASSHPSIRP